MGSSTLEFESLLAFASLAILGSLRYFKPLDITSKLDEKKHAQTFLPITFSNKRISFLTIFLPAIIVIVTELMFPSPNGMSHAPNYIYRWCLSGILVQVIKLLTSSPRPNAAHLENRDVNKKYNNTNYESRQSFFSGHAAAGIMSVLFVKTYLTSKFAILHIPLSFLLPLGFYPGYTQWKQHWHHLHDVMIGFGYGFLSYLILFHWNYNWNV